MSDTTNLTKLGSNTTKYTYESPTKDTLETFKNLHEDRNYLVPFYCSEFTSLCPKTWQPDFAELHIMYVPRDLMIESKSLKLYLFSFRNSGEFHEDVCNRIVNDIRDKINPKYILVYGDFKVRWWIAIKPVIEYVADDFDKKEVEFKVNTYFTMNNK